MRQPPRRHPDGALQHIEENRAEQAGQHGDQRQVVEEPLERQFEKVEPEVDTKQRVRLAQHLKALRQQVIVPVGHGPVADKVAQQQDADPDQPAHGGTHPFEGRELDLIPAVVEELTSCQAAGKQGVQADHQDEARTG